MFAKAKSAGRTSKNPLREAFGSSLNRKYVFLALFGSTAGMGVVWYTGQFYALTFLQSTLKPGSRVVSHRFTMGDWEPDMKKTVDSTSGDACDVLLWYIKGKAKE